MDEIMICSTITGEKEKETERFVLGKMSLCSHGKNTRCPRENKFGMVHQVIFHGMQESGLVFRREMNFAQQNNIKIPLIWVPVSSPPLEKWKL